MNIRNILLILCGLMMIADLWLIFQVAPTDATLGNVQRVFYFHVPVAIISFLAFFVVFVASIGYLVRRSLPWDQVAYAAAEVGVLFVSLALITGIIWAKPVWNTWWTFEPRLTTTLILWFIYVAYLMIGYAAPTREKGGSLLGGCGHHRLHRRSHRLLFRGLVAVHSSAPDDRADGRKRSGPTGNDEHTDVFPINLPVAIRFSGDSSGLPSPRRG